jgi:hypothetical protein
MSLNALRKPNMVYQSVMLMAVGHPVAYLSTRKKYRQLLMPCAAALPSAMQKDRFFQVFAGR